MNIVWMTWDPTFEPNTQISVYLSLWQQSRSKQVSPFLFCFFHLLLPHGIRAGDLSSLSFGFCFCAHLLPLVTLTTVLVQTYFFDIFFSHLVKDPFSFLFNTFQHLFSFFHFRYLTVSYILFLLKLLGHIFLQSSSPWIINRYLTLVLSLIVVFLFFYFLSFLNLS